MCVAIIPDEVVKYLTVDLIGFVNAAIPVLRATLCFVQNEILHRIAVIQFTNADGIWNCKVIRNPFTVAYTYISFHFIIHSGMGCQNTARVALLTEKPHGIRYLYAR